MRHETVRDGDTTSIYRAGTILVWKLVPDVLGADSVVLKMSSVARARELGDWSICRYGVRLEGYYFDLTINRDVTASDIKLWFDSDPLVY